MFLCKNLFFNIFCFFNPNNAYWNQRRLFSGNLPGMFCISADGIEYDENTLCDVCREGTCEEGNEILFCDKCDIAVHQVEDTVN